MLKNLKFAFIAVGLAAACAGTALAGGNTTNGTGNAKVYVDSDISISNTNDLDFGGVYRGQAAVTMDAITGSNTPTTSPGGSAGGQPGKMHISGDSGRTFNVTLPNDTAVVLTNNGGTGGTDHTFAVTGFTAKDCTSSTTLANGTTSVAVDTLSGSTHSAATGTADICVGATLAAAATTQTTGAYTATYTVVVTYATPY